jgi:CSLREA domain-containing protein
MKTRIRFLFTLLCAATFSLPSVHAATLTVTNTNDSGAGSLREALADASNGDTIDFSVTTPATITLTSGQLVASSSVTISGPGANLLTIDANHASRVFSVNSGLSVTISGLTITNGSLSQNGGGILNSRSTLTISKCTISGNFGTRGGGIFNDHGNLTVNNCSISGNSTQFGGGGIDNFTNGNGGTGTLSVVGSTISGNSAGDFGGAIRCEGGFGGASTASVVASTLSGNSAADRGGAIHNGGDETGSATLTIINSTLSGNSAVNFGGGILNSGGGGSATLTINNSTLSGNSASGAGGGGIYNFGTGGSATLTIGDTIFNAGASGANIVNDDGTVNSLGYNLSSDDASAFLNATGDHNSTDPMLGPLAYYGGPTATHILKAGSPAIDAGDPNFAGPPSNDQRGAGFARVANSRIDIGALEREPNDIDPTLVVTTTADTNANSSCDPANPCSLRDAITAANTSAPDDVIYFDVTGTITLTTALPNLNSNMKILGPAANALTVKGLGAPFRIFTINGGTVTLSGMTVANGLATTGGGILNNGTLTVSSCTVRNNSLTGLGPGGGAVNFGVLTVNNSTFSGNSAGHGGGISNLGTQVIVNNSTFNGNSATGAGGGGGIINETGTLTVNNSTFSGNYSGLGLAGGINTGGALTIGGTILNAGASGANLVGAVTSLGYNLSSDDESTLLNQMTDQNSTNPMLGPLQDNGGPTFTHAIDCNSPAADRGNNFAGATTDQRGAGFDRTVGSAAVTGGDGTDIGAFEVQTVCNTAPTITAATGVTRQQGAASSISQIATVSDNQDPPTSLTVTINGSSTMNGVTVSSIAVDNSGNVTANVVASCSASSASFTLRVTDTGGLHSDGTLTVNVTPSNAPVITLKPAAVLQPAANHGYHTFAITQMVQSATDDCDGNVINNVVIEKATSDEVEDSPGGGDGNTRNDIVIAANCKSVQLRAERDGTLNGRVYLVTLRVSDSSGNIVRATYKVSVPVGHNAAVDSGVHYTVNSSCN